MRSISHNGLNCRYCNKTKTADHFLGSADVVFLDILQRQTLNEKRQYPVHCSISAAGKKTVPPHIILPSNAAVHFVEVLYNPSRCRP